MRAAFLLIAVIFAPATASLAQQPLSTTGLIRGTVRDDQNQPLDGATVTLDLMDDLPSQRSVPTAKTDGQGNFVIDHLRWGKYRIFVGKEEAGYPDTRYHLYSGGVYPTAEISPEHPEASVVLSVGPKAGALAVVVLDASTGQPIDASLLGGSMWIWSEGYDHRMGGSIIHENRLLIPPFVAVGVEIGADGYKPERYPEKIVLPPSGEMTIKVNLWPVPKKP
jgi:Carboxypeptidase regulatory-like domain